MTRFDDKTLALLSGYAAGVLTPEEHRFLMEASLRDQAVFDALADEESLRALLADDAVRVRLASLLEKPVASPVPALPWYRRPWAWAAASVPVLAGLALLLLLPPQQPEPSLLARAQRQEVEVAAGIPPRTAEMPPAAPLPLTKEETAVRSPSPAERLQRNELKAAPTQAGTVVTVSAGDSSPDATGASAASPRQNAVALLESAPPPSAAPAPAPPPQSFQASVVEEGAPRASRVTSLPSRERARQEEAGAAQALTFVLLTQSASSGPWRVAADNEELLASGRLRIRATAAREGMLRVTPGGKLRPVDSSTNAVEIDLDPLPPGEHEITVTWMPAQDAISAKALARSRFASQAAQPASPVAPAVPVTARKKIVLR